MTNNTQNGQSAKPFRKEVLAVLTALQAVGEKRTKDALDAFKTKGRNVSFGTAGRLEYGLAKKSGFVDGKGRRKIEAMVNLVLPRSNANPATIKGNQLNIDMAQLAMIIDGYRANGDRGVWQQKQAAAMGYSDGNAFKADNADRSQKPTVDKTKATVVHIDGSFKNRQSAVVEITSEGPICVSQSRNFKIQHQIEIEAFAFLKAIFGAQKKGIKNLIIKTDVPCFAGKAEVKSKTLAGKYLSIAKKVAAEAGINGVAEGVPSEANLADKASRFILGVSQTDAVLFESEAVEKATPSDLDYTPPANRVARCLHDGRFVSLKKVFTSEGRTYCAPACEMALIEKGYRNRELKLLKGQIEHRLGCINPARRKVLAKIERLVFNRQLRINGRTPTYADKTPNRDEIKALMALIMRRKELILNNEGVAKC